MADLDPAVAQWAAAVPLEHVVRELETLERERLRLDARIALLKRHVGLLSAVRAFANGSAAPLPVPSKRDAILRVLAENPTSALKLSEIREELVRRGWLAGDRRSVHALEVAITSMARRGDLRRVRRGLYELAPPPSHEVAA